MRNDNILEYNGVEPRLERGVVIMNSAIVIGDVEIGEGSSVWCNSVIRGDEAKITIGKFCNIQDLCMIHTSKGLSEARIGDYVTVGHNVTLHGPTIGSNTIIGMGSVVLDGATIGEGCLIGAGSLITGGSVIPAFSLAVGSPCKVKRQLTLEEIEYLKNTALQYAEKAKNYAVMGAGLKKP